MKDPAFETLYAHAETLFRAGIRSDHGPDHWRRVEDAVMLMASETGCDVTIGRLFAIYHDACRVNDGADLDHGLRAAALLRRILGVQFTLTAERMDLLTYAVSEHTRGKTSADPTIGTCWDADRLDLTRVGIMSDAGLMSTAVGKRLALAGSTIDSVENRRIPTTPSSLPLAPLGN